MENNPLAMLLEELIDASNYARYTFISLVYAAEQAGMSVDEGQGHNLGPDAFTPTSPTREEG